jgi:hypothetical protein
MDAINAKLMALLEADIDLKDQYIAQLLTDRKSVDPMLLEKISNNKANIVNTRAELQVSQITCLCCASSNIEFGGDITEMRCPVFFDNLGKSHHHDKNIETSTYKCRDCAIVWSQNIVHKCWCGWVQEVDDSGYQGQKFKTSISQGV